MPQEILNEVLLDHNECFGCGLHNPQGLQIKLYRNLKNPNQLIGKLEAAEFRAGFHGITHGGVVYTALDCMGAWVPTVLREEKAIWILRNANVTYHRPAHANQPIKLAGEITKQGNVWEAIEVLAQAKDEQDQLLVEGKFKVIPLPPDKFKQIMGISELPENYQKFLGEVA